MTSCLVELQETLNHEIPLTAHLGLRVAAYESGSLILAAPLAPNINHKDTAFAGSLNAVVTLAGWSLLWLVLREHRLPGKVVIQDSTIRYLRPVTRDFEARCNLPPTAELEQFVRVLRRKGRARLELHATIEEDGLRAVEFSGRYVVLTEPEA